MHVVEGYCQQQTGFKLKQATNKVLHLEHSFVWWWSLDT